MTNERLYTHFGLNRDLIPLQEQVRTDIYNILKSLGMSPQTPSFVAISTKNGIHKIINYPFNITPNHWGQYKHHFCLEVKTDYKIEELEELVKHQVRTLFEEG